jgi:hypothetical protein
MGLAAAACQGDGYGQPSGYQPAYNNGYYAPPPPRYAYSQPAPNYYYNQNQAYYGNPYQGQYQNQYQYQNQGQYNQADGRRYTTVAVTNRGQNGYRDDVVQQQVVCGSQYYDGYRTRIAPRC